MASVLGIAGIGKSRLAWELASRARRTPRGRMADRRRTAYGNGVAFWRSARSSGDDATSPSTRRQRSQGASWKRRSAEFP